MSVDEYEQLADAGFLRDRHVELGDGNECRGWRAGEKKILLARQAGADEPRD